MIELSIEISRFVDEYQPGIIECKLVDAHGVQHLFIEKVPYVTEQNLWSDSNYPQPGYIRCEILEEWKDTLGQSLLRVNTTEPWGIESTEGLTSFVVYSSQVLHK